MINKTTLEYINPNLKYSISRYFPIHERTILYDMLVFVSIVSKTPSCCSGTDLDAFEELLSNCKQLDISLEQYVSCAYEYIGKYSTPGHKIYLSYFLNEKVVEYCASKLEGSTGHSLFLEEIKDDLLSTEKHIRDLMSEYTISYDLAFGRLLKKKQISPYFLAYKKFCESPLLEGLTDSDYLYSLVNILEPFFTCILAKNHIYIPYKIKQWNNSKIEDFNFCPLFFRDRYITNSLCEQNLGNEATSQGTAIHKIFEDILKKYRDSKRKNLKTIAEKYFTSTAFTQVETMLADHIPFIKEQFLNEKSHLHTVINKDSQIFIEHTMSAKLTDVTFVGTADLIIVNGTEAHVLDYKSSKLDPKYLDKNNAKYAKQLSLYSKLFKVEHPEITSITNTIIYTRGLIEPLDVNDFIHIIRSADIENIKKTLRSGVLLPNTSNCFLCRHPDCKFRKRESIWNEDGTRRTN